MSSIDSTSMPTIHAFRAGDGSSLHKVHLSGFEFDDKASTFTTSVNPKTKSGVGYLRSRLTAPDDDEKLKGEFLWPLALSYPPLSLRARGVACWALCLWNSQTSRRNLN
jgi:hypothetical protein